MFMRRAIETCVVAVTVFAIGQPAASGEKDVPSRKALVRSLRQQEELIRSMVVDYTVFTPPTAPEMIPDLRAVCEARGLAPDELGRYILSAETARKRSWSERWWRKGEQERIEMSSHPEFPETRPKTYRAFDGEFVRAYWESEKGPSGSIEPVVKTPFRETDRLSPFSLVYEYASRFYSDILESGPGFSATPITVDDQPMTRVTVGHPTYQGISFVLLFDANHRVVQRDVLATSRSRDGKQPVMYCRVELDDYRRHAPESGESIWFPHKALYHWYVGKLPDGRMVEYEIQEVEIRTVEFNVDVPDDIFVLRFPKTVRVLTR